MSGNVCPEDRRKADQASPPSNSGFRGCLLILFLGLLGAVPTVLLAGLVVALILSALPDLLLVVGADRLCWLAGFLMLAAFAGLLIFPVPQLGAKVAVWVEDLVPERAAKPVLYVVRSALVGLFGGVFIAAFSLIKAFKTDSQGLVLGGAILGMLAIGVIAERRRRRTAGSGAVRDT